MEKILLQANSRTETGKQNGRLRRAGFIPAVVYGRGKVSASIKLPVKDFERVYADAGGNKIVGLKVDEGNAANVLIHDVQTDPLTGHLTHADLYLVRMDEKIKTEVPLHFVGESTAVYQQEGTLFKNLEELEIEALPANLPESIEVDISILDDFDKTIHVSDLKIPADITLLTDPEELVAKVEPPRSDEELEALEEEIVEELPEGAEEEEPTVEKEGGTGEGGADRPGAGDPQAAGQ